MNNDERKKELISVLWNGADVLRSKMDANEYKDYLLGLVFYKYLSDKYLYKAYDVLYDEEPKSIEEAQKAYEEAYNGEDKKDLLKDLKSTFHYVIEPELTFYNMANKAENNKFNREELQLAFNNIEDSDELFAHLFDNVDLYSNRLGMGDTKQSATVAELVKEINKADLINATGDVLGAAYEYLIGQFASETGKKAGEFYTAAGPAELLTQIAIEGNENKKGLQVYDPCMGSGSLLLDAKKYSKEPDYIQYYGQALNNGDTLDEDWPSTEETVFDMVVMNPPYSAKWSAASGFLSDDRFTDYGVLAPKSKADYAFLLHGLYHLKPTGTMGIVLPHGVLFRGGTEGKIRQKLLENGSIYAVIGLPANLFYNTSIPTCIIVLKKHREGRDVLFIDASKQFEKEKKQNIMRPEHINHIMELYNERKSVDKETYLASFDDIKNNDYNLNIPRYVDTFEEEEQILLGDLLKDMQATDTEINSVKKQLVDSLQNLVVEDKEVKSALSDLINIMEEM